jgi:hypothetical protein
MPAIEHSTDVRLTLLERNSLQALVACIVNDEGFDTYGLSPREQAAVRRALVKLSVPQIPPSVSRQP